MNSAIASSQANLLAKAAWMQGVYEAIRIGGSLLQRFLRVAATTRVSVPDSLFLRAAAKPDGTVALGPAARGQALAAAPGFWGRWCGLDMHGCDLATITDPKAVEQYIVELCSLLGFKRYGEPTIVRFGDRPEIAGFSFTQLIETSLVSGHLVDASQCVFIDIFSCAPYSTRVAEEFTRNYFRAAGVVNHSRDRFAVAMNQLAVGVRE